MDKIILSIDPGRKKCGIALVDFQLKYLMGSVVNSEALLGTIKDYFKKHRFENIIVGSGTNSGAVIATLKEKFPEVGVTVVSEKDTTIEARKYYFEYNPPRGWLKILPRSLRIPPRPYDDFAAYAIARRFFTDCKKNKG